MTALFPGKAPQYPFSRGWMGPQRESGCFGEDQNLLPLLSHPTHNLVFVLTRLLRLTFFLIYTSHVLLIISGGFRILIPFDCNHD